MRKRLYEIIEVAKENDRWSQMYDFFMIFMIFISLAPLTVKEQTAFFHVVDKLTAFVFIIDYSFFKIEIQRQKQKFFELNDFMGVPVVFTTVRPFALALSVAGNGQRLRRGYSP